MYQEHECFIKPDNPNCTIWRYMDFTKFIDLLTTKKLFFSRADLFGDPFEGAWPIANVKIRENRPDLFKEGAPLESIKKMQNLTYREFRKFVVINCWHINEGESAAMWKLYLKSNEGLAIQSTFRKLISSFNDDPSYAIHVGKVHYINYERYFMPETNLFFPYLHKRKSYEHEKELRAIIMNIPSNEGGGIDIDATPFEDGHKEPVDLDILIQKIVVCPTAPKWITELIEKVLEKYSLNKKVEQSDLDSSPFH